MMFVEKIVPVARERLVTVRDDALLVREAAKFLDGRHINLVVVCDKGGAMVGIVTRTDVVRQMGRCQGSGCTAAVAAVMTKDVTYCRSDDLLQDVWSIMKERKLLHVPIVDEDFRPVGRDQCTGCSSRSSGGIGARGSASARLRYGHWISVSFWPD